MGTMAVLWVIEASVASTRPKQWKKGTGNTEFVVLRKLHAVAYILAVVNDVIMGEHDTFGKAVVPEVYCIFTTSS